MQGGTQDLPPGILNYLDIDEAAIAAVARRYARQLSITGQSLSQSLSRPMIDRTHDKIRLGYLSTDFFTHAVGTLVRELFACHDRAVSRSTAIRTGISPIRFRHAYDRDAMYIAIFRVVMRSVSPCHR